MPSAKIVMFEGFIHCSRPQGFGKRMPQFAEKRVIPATWFAGESQVRGKVIDTNPDLDVFS
jgi:hypothetical protein